MNAAVSIKSAMSSLTTMEDDLIAYSELIREYGSLTNLVNRVNEARFVLGLPKWGDAS